MSAFGEIAVRDESGFLRWRTADPQAITWEEASRRISELGHFLAMPNEDGRLVRLEEDSNTMVYQ